MNTKGQIEQISKEIEVYSSHALFSLAKQKCFELVRLVENVDQFEYKNVVLEEISKQIGSIEDEERGFLGINRATRMSNKELDVVKQMVCAPGEADSDEGIWEVARACLILGQYETALWEFNRLINSEFKRISAAKNMLRCHIGMGSFDRAINQYKDWALSGLFSLGQMENIRTFLQKLLYKNNINKLITSLKVVDIDHEQDYLEADDSINIIGAKITVKDDSGNDLQTMLAVNKQNGSTFTAVVPGKKSEVMKYLIEGEEINNVEIYSSSLIFTGRCVTCKKSKVKNGPREGDYVLSLRILESE